MAVKDIFMLGNPLLHNVSKPVEPKELNSLIPIIDEMFKTIVEFRRQCGAGRAIAAPQLGVQKRIICLNIDNPVEIINPVLSELSPEVFEMWDDCMSFPNLLVKLKRHKSLTLNFYDRNWNEHTWQLQDDMAELIQHEYDHLEGILATQRAIDSKSFRWKI
jgi:peptide deformylase